MGKSKVETRPGPVGFDSLGGALDLNINWRSLLGSRKSRKPPSPLSGPIASTSRLEPPPIASSSARASSTPQGRDIPSSLHRHSIAPSYREAPDSPPPYAEYVDPNDTAGPSPASNTNREEENSRDRMSPSHETPTTGSRTGVEAEDRRKKKVKQKPRRKSDLMTVDTRMSDQLRGIGF
ncbi:hypothetical protein JCM16303_002020 [Sporobolomyces ruberrimus]